MCRYGRLVSLAHKKRLFSNTHHQKRLLLPISYAGDYAEYFPKKIFQYKFQLI